MRKIGIILMACLLLTWSLPAVGAEEDYAYRRVKITKLSGDVFVRQANTTKWVIAEKDMILGQEDAIKTGPNGFATILFDEKGLFEGKQYDSIDLYENTELAISKVRYDKQKDVKTTLLKMNIGRIMANAAKLEGDSKFEVQTPTSVVGVRGTRYIVAYQPE